MIHDLKPYPAYKASGVPWLGDVPEHWAVLRIKDIARLRSGDNITALNISDSGRYPVYGGNGVRGFASAYTHEGEYVLIGRQGALCGNINYAKGQFWASEHAVVAQPRRLLDLFWFGELLRTMNLNQYSMSAAQPGLAVERIQSLRLPVPPAHEQAAIGRFLKFMYRRVRRYIGVKRKLIASLNEQKQAIVLGAVTRGLDYSVLLKPSGLEWLGDVPEHWEVRPAKYFFREVDERSATGAEELLSVSHITGVSPRSQKSVTMFMASSYVGHKLCRPGDLVINTMWAWMAALGVARQTGIVSPSYGVYRPLSSSRLHSDYADLLLRTRPYVSEYVCRSTGIRSSRLRLYPEQFLLVRLICPPPEEQQIILHWVATETAEAERAIAGAQCQINLLREYWTRLIADLVTGKLNIREAAALLPEEAEDPDPLYSADAFAEGDDETGATDLDGAPEEVEA